jgi:amidase
MNPDRPASSIDAYSSAGEMLAALKARQISARELVELHVERIERFDPALNAIAVPTFDRARQAAEDHDRALAAGETRPLLGLPLTLKESTQVAGLPQSAGVARLEHHRPVEDGPVASSVSIAGASLLGTTNVAAELRDWQADNPVYGRTNNPWGLDRTPGGSTGGGAAALAAGMTPLEVGSDIAGSIRVPAAYCGVYGHRPSETAVPRYGAYPADRLPNPASLMLVQGPLARTAEDLELLLDVLTGPEVGEDRAWRLSLPAPRHERLADFCVAVMPPLSTVAPSVEMQERVEELARFLSRAGATVAETMPALDPDEHLCDYFTLLTVMGRRRNPPDDRGPAGPPPGGGDGTWIMAEPLARALGLGAVDFLALLQRREEARTAWREFFGRWDVLLSPAALGAAFRHVTGNPQERTVTIDGGEVPYVFHMVYPMWAAFSGHPATAFPGGLGAEGLPLGLQVMGPYLEDRTTLRFAQLLEREWRSFERPPLDP